MNHATKQMTYFGILEQKSWSLKQKKKAMTSLLASIGGGSCPLEALALIMGRNEKLCDNQMSTVDDINFSLNYTVPKLMMSYEIDRTELVELLFDSRVMSVSIRLIAVQSIKPINQEGKDKDKFFQIRFGCIRILVSFAKSKELNNAIWKEELSNPDLFTVLSKCVKTDSSFVVIIFTLRLLFILLKKYKQFMWFEKYAGQLDCNALASLLHKENVPNKVSKWFADGLSEFEAIVLFSELGTILKSVTPTEFAPQELLVREIKSAGTKCLIAVHLQSASVVLFLYSIPAMKKRIQSTLQTIDVLPSLMKWTQVMPVTSEDKNRMWFSLQLLAVSVDNCQIFAKKVMQYPNFIESLELAIRHPDSAIVEQCATLMRVLMESGSTSIKSFVKNKATLTALIDNCYSSNIAVQKTVLAMLHSIASKHTTSVLIKHGLTPCELVKLQFYYSQTPELSILLFGMRAEFAKYSNYNMWKKSEDQGVKKFDPATATKNFSFILTVKGIGNDFYNRKSYEHAIEMYTTGLEQCPPTLSKNLSLEERKLLAPDLEETDTEWYALPAALHANRAQCYIHLNEYEKAIGDCDRAIVLCNMEVHEGHKLCIKTTMRRSIAAFELHKYPESLRDVMFCLNTDPANPTYKQHFNKVYGKYRDEIGTSFLVKRCAVCLGGEGEKLKRCANCEEIYCSPVCQKEAWDSGHKEVCRKNGTVNSTNAA